MRPITFQTKIYELLEDYPQLEELLPQISPAFVKLKNPLLRKTIARVTTIQQAASIAGIEAGEIVSRLREAAGLSSEYNDISNADDTGDGGKYTGDRPGWFIETNVGIRFDAGKALQSGDIPMASVLNSAKRLNPGEIFEFNTPFLPVPILDILSNKGFCVWSEKIAGDKGVEYLNRVIKNEQ